MAPATAIAAATARRQQAVPIFKRSKRWARVAIRTDVLHAHDRAASRWKNKPAKKAGQKPAAKGG
jgi:hypothetical protein